MIKRQLLQDKLMKRIINFYVLGLLLLCLQGARAEIIENQTITNEEFGPWVVSCREDVMLSTMECKFFTQITDNTVLFINPDKKNNEIVIISNDMVPGSKMMLKIDKFRPILSNIKDGKNIYNVVNLEPADKFNLFNQIRSGTTLYTRLTISDQGAPLGRKEITAKLSLTDFSKALVYYESQNTGIHNRY